MIHHRFVLQCLTAVIALLMLAGCGEEVQPAVAVSTNTADPLEISPNAELKAQLKIGEPRSEAVSATLRVAGRVEADETRLARVSAPVTGRIVEMEVFEGQHVKRGQVLATVYSTELSSAQSLLLKAHTQRELAQRAVERARQLLEAGVIGAAELQKREGELQQASADLAAGRQQLSVLGLEKEAVAKLEKSRVVDSMTRILSTIDGTVLERHATVGQVVQAVETVFVIADLSRVWLVADVPEQSAGAIEVGKVIEAEIPALPGEKITGKLSFVSAMVNPETRTVRTRMNLANPQRRFKPAMLANITLMDGAERKRVVPASAVVREENLDYVFVEKAANKYVLRRVDLGEEYGEARVLEGGVAPGEKIVLAGAFHLNNERKRQAISASEGE